MTKLKQISLHLPDKRFTSYNAVKTYSTSLNSSLNSQAVVVSFLGLRMENSKVITVSNEM